MNTKEGLFILQELEETHKREDRKESLNEEEKGRIRRKEKGPGSAKIQERRGKVNKAIVKKCFRFEDAYAMRMGSLKKYFTVWAPLKAMSMYMATLLHNCPADFLAKENQAFDDAKGPCSIILWCDEFSVAQGHVLTKVYRV
ncbi:hypothetical protein NDU88_003890 [Pleurodeles waltl]|uniref:Uncharacterized protein n=1 Tax=Pleurodeles waltl TaxID=8319 RepID=A0AAV7W3F3_PLEWA|nr:hypothetical protein NDU88_003890 [Pleurodeles waltl]